MGFSRNQTLKKKFGTLIIITTFSLLLVISFVSCSSSPRNNEIEIQPASSSPSTGIPTTDHHQVLYVKKSRPFISNNQETAMNKNRLKMRKMKRKKSTKNLTANRQFSVMLPKGFIPPSGSSPCHNMKPDLVAFYCDLSAQKP